MKQAAAEEQLGNFFVDDETFELGVSSEVDKKLISSELRKI